MKSSTTAEEKQLLPEPPSITYLDASIRRHLDKGWTITRSEGQPSDVHFSTGCIVGAELVHEAEGSQEEGEGEFLGGEIRGTLNIYEELSLPEMGEGLVEMPIRYDNEANAFVEFGSGTRITAMPRVIELYPSGRMTAHFAPSKNVE